MYSRKIIFRGKDTTDNNNGIKGSTSNSNQVISNKISSTIVKSTHHTVTPVTLPSPVHFSKEGLDFILSHLQEPIWPRTISTKTTGGRQVIVNSKGEALAYFKAANYFDCRISAYPYWRLSPLSNFVGIKNLIPPNLIMIDLDSSNFDETNRINVVLRKILRRIDHLLNLTPTIIWSGNGYHIYIPINAVVLEDIKEFVNMEQVSTRFLRFAEWYLSSGKSDPAHNTTVSLSNCMLRIPGTCNSKNNVPVKIIKKWDNNRPRITLLLGSFCAYLKDQKLKELKLFELDSARVASSISENIPWIDRLLQTPISDGRKYCIWRIVVPYLINKRHMPVEQSRNTVIEWLDSCSKIVRLDFVSGSRIDYALRHVGKYGPVHPETLRKEYDALYKLLKSNGVL